MTKVLEWAESEQIPYGAMSPMQFAKMMSERLGVEINPFDDVEDTAAKWLEAIDERSPTAGD